ncbi:aldehyde dehydrogenase family protein [Actinomadura sp. 7K507]|uniref:aldehyde dehydrogenase family protein n=1 Tax=Actinomadura sp. 7K507 TaxID=2530365 RepID=UPI001052A242|nr:aldehyde dehydrogenase family protein [Actinomadura sp. 7K507]TDC80530.1 aldehyde dehydrogenase [Actinomadura sp. 7K507]
MTDRTINTNRAIDTSRTNDTNRTNDEVESRNPATGKVAFTSPATALADVGATVGRAHAAQEAWARRPIQDRQAVLRDFAGLVERDASRLAELIVAEMGKLHRDAVAEAAWTVTSARWYADHPPPVERRGGAVVRRRPLGVVAAITPWNVPLLTPAWKWLPALLAGNTVVWKPSELASGTAVAARELLREAGLPPGAMELVLGGPDRARALCADPRVASVHFTGSTAAGRAISQSLAGRFVPCALEMGGLNAALVFPDADLEHAADCIIAAGTAINGQKCTATRRVLVHEAAADALMDALATRIGGLTSGDPARPDVDLGPLVNPAAATRAERAVADAASCGARVVARSPSPSPADPAVAPEAFFPATLLTGLSPDEPLRRHELFAPVVSVETFPSADAAWPMANATPFGLSASVFTADPAIAAEAAEVLHTGVVAVNRRGDAVDLEAPFAGVKDSGNGHPEGGEYVYSSLTTLQAHYQDVPVPTR